MTVARKLAGLFLEYLPDAAQRLEAVFTEEQPVDTTIGFPSPPWMPFCVRMHRDQRVQEEDPFPLLPETVDDAHTNCLLIPWNGKQGRITPGGLQYLIQEAGSEGRRRKLEMNAVLQEREPVADWWEVPEKTFLLMAAYRYGLPVIRDVAGKHYVGRWEFDKRLSGKERSTVFWAAKQLIQQELTNP